MKRSILTQQLSQRETTLSRKYCVDPLEVILVAEVMQAGMVVLPEQLSAEDARQWMNGGRRHGERGGQRLYPMVDAEGRLTGVMTRGGLSRSCSGCGAILFLSPRASHSLPRRDIARRCRRMATRRLFTLPVVEPETGKLLGLLNAEDVLQVRSRLHDRENRQERLRVPFRRRRGIESEATAGAPKNDFPLKVLPAILDTEASTLRPPLECIWRLNASGGWPITKPARGQYNSGELEQSFPFLAN